MATDITTKIKELVNKIQELKALAEYYQIEVDWNYDEKYTEEEHNELISKYKDYNFFNEIEGYNTHEIMELIIERIKEL